MFDRSPAGDAELRGTAADRTRQRTDDGADLLARAPATLTSGPVVLQGTATDVEDRLQYAQLLEDDPQLPSGIGERCSHRFADH